MKPFILFLLISPILLSAQVPNGGFENWDSVGTHLYPTGWGVNSGLDEFSYSVRKSSDAPIGDYALHLSSEDLHPQACFSYVYTYFSNPFDGENSQVFSFYYKSIPWDERIPPFLRLSWTFYKDGRLQLTNFEWEPPIGGAKEYEKVEIELPVNDYDLMFFGILGSAAMSPVDGCSGFTDSWIDGIEISEVVSTGEISESEFRILGNPVGDWLRIDSDQMPQTLRVLDLNGRSLLQDQKTQELQVDHLAPGLYLLDLRFENGSQQIEKWMKL